MRLYDDNVTMYYFYT